jgi:hypothetical protein
MVTVAASLEIQNFSLPDKYLVVFAMCASACTHMFREPPPVFYDGIKIEAHASFQFIGARGGGR